MSPQLDYHIARTYQAEIASRAQQSQQLRDLHETVERPGHGLRVRVGKTFSALGVGLAATWR
jgi:hypothetical protein